MAKGDKGAEVPTYFVKEPRMFKGKELEAGAVFDLSVVGCSAAEAATWHAQGLLATAEEMAKLATIEPAPSAPTDGGAPTG